MNSPSLSLIDKGRAAKLAKLVENAKRKDRPDTYPIPWRGKREYLPVIRVETDWVLLNLDNGRTSAEQEVRALQEGDPDLFADPMSEKSQKAQEAILRELDDEAFSDLCRDLEARGQKDPAIVTAAGVLVNGNRRCAALRALKEEYMSIVVLDDDASPKEIRTLEFELQIAKDFREEYGDVNRLLMIERLMQEDGYDAESIAKRLRMSKDDVLAEKGVLELMREYIASVDGSELLGNLKGKYQAFKELYGLLQDTRKNGQPDRAEKIKSARFLGIMAGAGYRELRAVNEKFADHYLAPVLEKEPDLKSLVADPGDSVAVDLGPLNAFVGGSEPTVDKGQVVFEKLVSIAKTQSTTGGQVASGTVTARSGAAAAVPGAGTTVPSGGASVAGTGMAMPGGGAAVTGVGAPLPNSNGGIPGADVASPKVPSKGASVLPGPGSMLPNPTLERARKAIQEAAKDALQDAKDEKNSSQPLVLLAEAINKLRRINIAKAKAAGAFKAQEFLKALAELRQVVDELEDKGKQLGES